MLSQFLPRQGEGNSPTAFEPGTLKDKEYAHGNHVNTYCLLRGCGRLCAVLQRLRSI